MDNIKRFGLAVQSLSRRLTEVFSALGDEDKNRIREIRLRSRSPVVVMTEKGAEFVMNSGRLTRVYSELLIKTDEHEIEEIFKRLCGYSVHSFKDAINRGYITVAGGHRAGIAGTAVTENGNVTAVRDICAINLRIAREIKGASDEIYKSEFSNGLCSVIIAGPPASGKTTVLRDLTRRLSDCRAGNCYKTFVCDERGEIGASFLGIAQNDLGMNCDLLTSYPKSEGIMIGLRSFSPDIIICDEVATNQELEAVEAGVNSGVCFALSIHARSEKELKTKLALKKLLMTGEFSKVILLSGKNVGKVEKIFGAGELVA
ncbi:MAG: hypothetical protein IJ264_02640 [Clostridia bacterium]|nr:hypothetical protein [Clostridia bacterium]